jgi:hypothetical protein
VHSFSAGSEEESDGGRHESEDSEGCDLPINIQDCEGVLSCSHSSLSGCLLAHMISESTADAWVATPSSHHSLTYMLCSALVHASWNKWPLVLDPQNLATQCIQQCSGGELIYLDATDR